MESRSDPVVFSSKGGPTNPCIALSNIKYVIEPNRFDRRLRVNTSPTSLADEGDTLMCHTNSHV